MQMNDLGRELLKLVDERALHERDAREKAHKQLSRFVEKLEKARKKFGKNLEILAKDLRKRISRKGLPAFMLNLLLPWRRYSDKRQLELIEVLISWHEAESKEFVLAVNALTLSYDPGSTPAQTKE